MQPQHRIEEMIVDLSFSTARLARCEKDKLADWLSDELLPALDRLFSHYVPGDQILRLDQLEFDLGNVASHNYQQVIGERLIAALSQILEQQLLATAPQRAAPQTARAQNGAAAAVAEPVVAEELRAQGNKLALQQLFSYLNSGQIRAHRIDNLPSTAASSPTNTATADIHSATGAGNLKQPALTIKVADIHEQLLTQVLGEQDIAALLRELPQRQALVQRLTKQFSEQYRVELLHQLAPRQIQMALALLDWLQVAQTAATRINNQLHRNNIAVNNVHQAPEDARVIPWDMLWEVLLDVALSQPMLSETAWLKLLLEKLAARLTISERELYTFFPLQNIEQWDSNNSTSATLTHLVESLNKTLKGSPLTSNPAPLSSTPAIPITSTTSIPINSIAVSDPLVSIAETSLTSQTKSELTISVTSTQSLVATNNTDPNREWVSEKKSISEFHSIAEASSVTISKHNAQMPIAHQRPRLPTANATQLDSAGDQQLFEFCLGLKSGSLPWAQLSGNAELLERLIKSYIRLGKSVAAEHSADFLSAITTRAPLSQHKASYYLQVLQRLLANELIDLEAIVDGVEKQTDQAVAQTNIRDKELIDPVISYDRQKGLSPSSALTTTGITHRLPENTIPKIVTSETVASETVSAERIAPKKYLLENSIPEDSGIEGAIGSSMGTDELVNELLTGNKNLASLQLNIPEWQLLVAALLRKKFFISTTTTQQFIAAVQHALTGSVQPAIGYRALIARLITLETLDAEAITAALKLQNRHLTWQALPTAADFLSRIVRSYIDFFPSLFHAGYADLVAPLETQAAVMDNNIQLYQQLLNLLFNTTIFDPDKFDNQLTNDNLEGAIQGLIKNYISKTNHSDVSTDSVNKNENASLFGSEQNSHDVFPVVDAAINGSLLDALESPSGKSVNSGYLLEELATGLLAGKIPPSQLDLSRPQWQRLVAVMIKQKYSVSATDINSLLAVLIDPLFTAEIGQSMAANSYRATIARIISMGVLDIEAIVAAMKLQQRLLSWEMVAENPDFLQRILRAYIEFSGKLATESGHKLIAVLNQPTTATNNSTLIYRHLFNQLFNGVAIDIEAFCDQLAPQVVEDSIVPKAISYDTNSVDADKAGIGNSDSIPPAATIPELVQQLLAGTISLRALELATNEWPQLIAGLMQFKYSSPADEIEILSATTERKAKASADPREFYRQVLTLLLSDSMLDLEEIHHSITQHQKEELISSKVTIDNEEKFQLLEKHLLEKSVLETSDSEKHAQEKYAQEKNVPQENAREKSAIENNTGSPTELDELANELLTGNARLNRLQLGNPEWQTLVAALLGKKFSVAPAAINHFIAAVQFSLSAAPQPVDGYPALIARLMAIATLDIEAITAALKLQARQITWQTASVTPALLPRMVQSYSEFFPDHSPTELAQRVASRAAVIDNNIPFYQQVLDALFNRMSFDPDQLSRAWAINNIDPGLNDINAGEKVDELEPLHRTAINSGAALETLARELLTGKSLATQVELSLTAWPLLIAVVIQQKHAVSAATINNLVSVLSESLVDPSVAVNRYRDILARIISLDALDLEAIVAGMKLQRRLLAWPTVAENPAFLRRILLGAIELSSKLTTENRRKLMSALNPQIANITNNSLIYRQLLNQLFSDDTIDIEQFCNLFAHQVEHSAQVSMSLVNDPDKAARDTINTNDQDTRIALAQNNLSVVNEIGIDTTVIESTDKNQIQHSLENRNNNSGAHFPPSAKPEIINTKIVRPNTEKQNASLGAENFAEQFLMLANSLVAKHLSLTDLVTRTSAFSDSDWAQLLSCLFQATQAAVMAPELEQAIAQFAAQARNRPNYYLQIAAALVIERSIDLEAFAALDNTSLAVDQPIQPQPLGQAPATGTMQNPIAYTSDNQDVPSEKILLMHLLAQDTPEREQLLLLQKKLNQLLHKTTAPLTAEWLQALANPDFCMGLIRAVPGHLLQQLCNHLQPRLFGPLDQLVKLVSEALHLLMPQLDQLKLKQAKWEFILHQLFAGGAPVSDKAQLTHECCLYLAAYTRCDDLESLIQLAQRRLVLLKPVAQLKPAMSLKDLGLDTTAADANKAESRVVGLAINNAGQVLVAPFLTRLFSMLNLTHEGKFIHLGAADRAAHLVQFIVNGQMETPEYELPLNKILCGISTSFPLSSGIIVTEQEQTLIEQMLTSMIQHWSALGSTSIAGLRETFFQRQGWLVLEEDCWRLTVQERTFDMLLDRLPWSIALIKHGWMDKPLRVSWRNQS